MAMQRIPLAEATEAQLRSFCDIVLQIDIPARATKQAILGKIAEVWTQETILFDDASGDTPSAAGRDNGMVNVRPRVDKDGNPVMIEGEGGKKVQEKEYRIRLHVSDKPGGDEPAFLSVNGRSFWIPRGEPVWVPEKYVRVLTDAQELHYPEYTGGDGGLGEPRVVPSYPFSHV